MVDPALRPALRRTDAEFDDRLRTLAVFDARLLAAASLIGFCVGAAMPLNQAYWPGEPPALATPEFIWNVLRNGAFAWLIARTLYVEIFIALRFSLLGERWARIDLLDLGPLKPFARRGLRSVLILMLLAALLSLFLLTPAISYAINVPVLVGIVATAPTSRSAPGRGWAARSWSGWSA